ncbi:MAG TPA: alpha/beta hydrolase [Ruminococcaceae bacterium]|nr:alpha/beta hydrolase [Oscillospiraceae bacterium]
MPFGLYYTEKGFGTPLVLLHGNGENGEYFKNQIDYFAKKYRVIAVDTRGHGKSPRGNKPFRLETFADDLKSFLDENNLKRVNLLGFSDGGNIALIFTLKYPDYVNKLAVNGANLFPSGLKAGFLLPVKLLYGLFYFPARFNKKVKRRLELLALMAKEPDILPEQLNDIKCPVLVMAGTRDLIKEKHTRLIAGSVPNSRLCFLKGDHSIAKTNSLEYNKTVEKFLEE